jgi:hypothetical protein
MVRGKMSLRSKYFFFLKTCHRQSLELFIPALSRMQRRTGRGQAHISPPQQMGRDAEKASIRPIGVRNRLWVVLILLIFIIAVALFTWPIRDSGPDAQVYSNAGLKSKNYFNSTEDDPNPFLFCPNYGPDDELGTKYGAVALSKSRFHLGSGDRIQRVLNRALAGQPVTISILGSSSEWLSLLSYSF